MEEGRRLSLGSGGTWTMRGNCGVRVALCHVQGTCGAPGTDGHFFAQFLHSVEKHQSSITIRRDIYCGNHLFISTISVQAFSFEMGHF